MFLGSISWFWFDAFEPGAQEIRLGPIEVFTLILLLPDEIGYKKG